MTEADRTVDLCWSRAAGGSAMMRRMAVYRTTFPIAASAERVWEVISDLDRWSEWNPSVPWIRGAVATGTRCDLKLVMPGRRFAWHGNIAHDRFFAGDRPLDIEPQDDGTVLVTHTEGVSGAFSPVFRMLMGERNIQAHHDLLNEGLARRAESSD